MRQGILVALIVLLAVGLVVLPLVLAAQSQSDRCYDEWERCRERALESDAGWFKTTLMLTACDVALFKCILAV